MNMPGETTDITVIEASIDDLNPEFYPYIIERLLEKGAPDAFLTPIIMKGGRPGTLLTVLAHTEEWPEIASVVFSETSTLGIRVKHEQRQILHREMVRVNTPYGEISIKIARLVKDGPLVQAAPEYRDCKEAAEKAGVPIKVIYNAALTALATAEPR
ncbi:MAG TPA: nickel insertion protein [Clostridia bacterium]|nr:nickel insertion protein [Clostridia bacterium]